MTDEMDYLGFDKQINLITKWKGEFDWLEYAINKSILILKCKICILHKCSNKFTLGCSNIKKEAVNQHHRVLIT